MTNKYNEAFQQEYLRNDLAKKGLLKEFKDTYKGNGPEIPNMNSGEMWDSLNIKISKKEYPMASDRIISLSKFLKGKNLNILNYGFGQGALEEEIEKKHNCTYLLGIDLSKKSVKKAQKRFKKWKFITGEFSKVKVDKESFDYVISSEVLEHISPKDTLNILNFFYKSLKKGGYLLISVPLNEGLEEMIKNGKNPNAHTRIYTPEIIMAELKISGFKYIKSKFLYAFRNQYFIKKLFLPLFRWIKKPNVVIILSQKV